MTAVVQDNAAWREATATLSVLIPFLRDDPTALLRQLDREAAAVAGTAEIVLLDDGTGDQKLTDSLSRTISAMALPTRRITLTANEGRARGRNRLTAAARGRWFLFLDSDMKPDRADFLHAWTTLIDHDPAVAFGGFSLDQAPRDAVFAVHRALSGASECLPAAERVKAPEKYVYTSNLLVRRDVFAAEAFDPGFVGWGWEDVEWAMRVSRRFPILHVDNPATHMGLDTAADLARKYDQGAANFARVARLHPEILRTYPSHRLARAMRRLPARTALRAILRRAAVGRILPVRARALALRLYRAAVYAEAL